MPNFDWLPEKAAENFRKHKVSFETGTRVFHDPCVLDMPDDRMDYGEERSNALGMVDDRVLVVTYTMREGTTWIISARRAEPFERRWYHEAKRED